MEVFRPCINCLSCLFNTTVPLFMKHKTALFSCFCFRDLSTNCLNCKKIVNDIPSDFNPNQTCQPKTQYRSRCDTGLFSLKTKDTLLKNTVYFVFGVIFTGFKEREGVILIITGVFYGVLFISIIASQFVTATLVSHGQPFTLLFSQLHFCDSPLKGEHSINRFLSYLCLHINDSISRISLRHVTPQREMTI